jgi:hypothetical protein
LQVLYNYKIDLCSKEQDLSFILLYNFALLFNILILLA